MENQEKSLSLFNGEGQNKVYCSLVLTNQEDKKKLFNTLESCDLLLNDCVGEEIAIKDIYVEQYEKADEETGEIKIHYRTILFDESGKTYATGSYGIYNVLNKIISIYGRHDIWQEPLKVKVSKKNIGNGKQSLTLILL